MGMKKKVVWLYYDGDTILGISNHGDLRYKYYHEDTDVIDDSPVYTGANSVFWNNLRDSMYDERATMYKNLRSNSNNKFSYDYIEGLFEDHQSKWPEALFNEDAYTKYIVPLRDLNNASYLTMVQGDKSVQRKNFLYKRFKLKDSLYGANLDPLDAIIFRANFTGIENPSMSIKPYITMYLWGRFGQTYMHSEDRVTAETAGTIYLPSGGGASDADYYIFNASLLLDVGDLSVLHPTTCDFSSAIRLRRLKLGDENTANNALSALSIGNCVMLEELDIQNCPNLRTVIDASKCINLETALCQGSQISILSLPNGGKVKTVKLPGTITFLSILNQKKLQTLVVDGYTNLARLQLENNSSAIDPIALIQTNYSSFISGCAIRIAGFNKQMASVQAVSDFYDILDNFRGLNSNGEVIHIYDIGGNEIVEASKPQMFGTFYINDDITGDEYNSLHDRYNNIEIDANSITSTVTYKDYNGAILGTEVVDKDGTATATGITPTYEYSNQYGTFRVIGWSADQNAIAADANALNSIRGDRTLFAIYTSTSTNYHIMYYNYDGTELLDEEYVAVGSTPYKYNTINTDRDADNSGIYTFSGWSETVNGMVSSDWMNNVSSDLTLYAVYTTTAKYALIFYGEDGTTILDRQYLTAGTSCVYGGSSSALTKADSIQNHCYYTFAGWATTLGGAVVHPSGSAIGGMPANNLDLYISFTATNYYRVEYCKYNETTAAKTVYIRPGTNATYMPQDGDADFGLWYRANEQVGGATYTYTFAGWSTTQGGTASTAWMTSISGDVKVWAAYTQSQIYTITFKNYDGTSTYETQTVVDGAICTYSGNITPAKESSGSLTYTFAGWNTAVNNGGTRVDFTQAIHSDMTVYAAFTSNKVVTLYYYDFNNTTLIASVQIESGEPYTRYSQEVAHPNAASTNDQNIYTFAGWYSASGHTTTVDETFAADANIDPDVIDGDTVNVYAAYYISGTKLALCYYNYNGTVLETQYLTSGSNGSYEMRVSDRTYEDNAGEHSFLGWNTNQSATVADANATNNITEDTDVYAIFEITTPKYTLLFYDDGVLKDTQHLYAGDAVAYKGSTLSRTNTIYDVYTFLGWNSDSTATVQDANALANMGNADRTLYAIWGHEEYYSVTYCKYNTDVDPYATNVIVLKDSSLSTAYTNNGGTAPTRAEDNEGIYTFVGWNVSQEQTTTTPDATAFAQADGRNLKVYAAFSKVAKYAITRKSQDGQSNLGIDYIAQGTTNYVPETPTMASDGTYQYTFDHWSLTQHGAATTAYTNITGALTLYAVFARNITITYKDFDGTTTLETQNISAVYNGTNYVGSGTYSGTPAKGENYTFKGWSTTQGTITTNQSTTFTQDEDISVNTTVYAAYYYSAPTYSVTWLFYSGNQVVVNNVIEGSYVTYTGQYPDRTNENLSFARWSPNPATTAITSNTTFTAQWYDTRDAVITYLSRTIPAYTSASAVALDNYAFADCTALETVAAPITSLGTNTFDGCTALASVDCTSTSDTLTFGNASVFNGCSNLETLILRSTTMCTLSNSSVFNGTKIGRRKGAIYVPTELVNAYKAASNWCNYIIADLNDYPLATYDTLTTKSLSDIISDAQSYENGNSHALDDYEPGDTKTITVGGVDYTMRIVGIAEDTISNSTSKAGLSIIFDELLNTTYQMNSSNITTDGWGACALRTTLNDENGSIFTSLPAELQSAIVQVKKPYYDVTSSSTLVSNDKLWIPSLAEFGFVSTGSYHTESTEAVDNASYVAAFGNTNLTTNSKAQYIKYRGNSATYWWLRSAYSANVFCNVNLGGNASSGNADYSRGVALGFCI